MAKEAIKVIADILKQEMGLRDDQILLAYQKFILPKTKDLFVSLSYLDTTILSSHDECIADDGVGMLEIQSCTVRHMIQIDVMSFDDSARMRKEEVLMALRSVYSEQQQAACDLQIARLPMNVANVSSLEESAFLNRFTITIACTSTVRKEKVPPYFDTFTSPEVHANV